MQATKKITAKESMPRIRMHVHRPPPFTGRTGNAAGTAPDGDKLRNRKEGRPRAVKILALPVRPVKGMPAPLVAGCPSPPAPNLGTGRIPRSFFQDALLSRHIPFWAGYARRHQKHGMKLYLPIRLDSIWAAMLMGRWHGRFGM